MERMFDCAVDDAGNPVLSENLTDGERKAFFRLFFETPTGRRLLDEVGVNDDTQHLIAQHADRYLTRNHIEFITLQDFEALVNQLLETHSFSEQQPIAPEPEDPRPRSSDGKFKSEFEIFCEGHSMQEIRARAQIDRKFGDWFRDAYSGQTIVEGPFRLAVPTRQATSSERAELESFADAFKTSPSASLRPQAGYVAINGKKYSVKDFRALVDRCSDIGLL